MTAIGPMKLSTQCRHKPAIIHLVNVEHSRLTTRQY